MRLKKGDKVMVIAGKSRGQSGAISRVLPKKGLIVIDGVNLVKRHRRATRQGGKGQIVDIPQPLHASSVQLVDPKSGEPTRVRILRGKDGSRTRVAVKSGQELK